MGEGKLLTKVMIMICDRDGMFVESERRTIVRTIATNRRMHCVMWRKRVNRGF